MRLLYGYTDAVADFVRRVSGVSGEYGPCVAIGVTRNDGALVGGVVFHDYREHRSRIEMSVGGVGNWYTPKLAPAIAQYVFADLGCDALIAWTPSDNLRARRLMTLLGGEHHTIATGETLITITPEAWAKSRIGQANGRRRITS